MKKRKHFHFLTDTNQSLCLKGILSCCDKTSDHLFPFKMLKMYKVWKNVMWPPYCHLSPEIMNKMNVEFNKQHQR